MHVKLIGVLVFAEEDPAHVGKVCFVGERVSILEDVMLLERSPEISLPPLSQVSELISES